MYSCTAVDCLHDSSNLPMLGVETVTNNRSAAARPPVDKKLEPGELVAEEGGVVGCFPACSSRAREHGPKGFLNPKDLCKEMQSG